MRTPGHRALRSTWPLAFALATVLAAQPVIVRAFVAPEPVHGLDPGVPRTGDAPVSVIVTGARDVSTLACDAVVQASQAAMH
jgi:hypothetical protein